MPLRKLPENMRVQVSENWVEEVLAFANFEIHDDIRVPTMVRSADKKEFGFGIDAKRAGPGPKEPLKNSLPEFTGVLGHKGLRRSQVKLKEALQLLFLHGDSPKVDQLICDGIDCAQLKGVLTFKDGYLQLQPTGTDLSLDQWWAIAVATLLDAGFGKRVRQCRWDNCAVFFIEWPGRKGQRRAYCCDNHQNNASQQRYRDNQKRKRSQQKANQSMGN